MGSGSLILFVPHRAKPVEPKEITVVDDASTARKLGWRGNFWIGPTPRRDAQEPECVGNPEQGLLIVQAKLHSVF